MIRGAAKGRKLVQILAALAVLGAVALPAGASIPRPGQLPGPNPAALLAAAREAPASKSVSAPPTASFELFAEPVGDRFRLSLQAAADAPAQARFHLLTPPKNRIRGVELPEPVPIGVELPPSRTAFRLYGELPYGFASGGLYITTDPLGYVDSPNLYQYGLNNPVNYSDPMGLCLGLKKYPGPCNQYYDEVAEAVSTVVVAALNLRERRLSASAEDLDNPTVGKVVADTTGGMVAAPLTLGEASGEWVATLDQIGRTSNMDERLRLYEQLNWQTPGMVLEVFAVGEGVNSALTVARKAPGVLLREGGEDIVLGAVDDGVLLATPNGSTPGRGPLPALVAELRSAGGTMRVARGDVSAQDLASFTRATGNEFALFRNRSTGELFVKELGPSMGEIPSNSRLILHSQPGGSFLAVQPSSADRTALEALGQRSSVIINADGTFSIRFRVTNARDEPIRALEPR